MTVRDLKKLLKGVHNDTPVRIPISAEFDGYFYVPCIADSGVCELGTEDIPKETLEIMHATGLPLPTEQAFLLVPNGFYEVKDKSFLMN